MANIKILLVDTDEKYLMPLERKFIDEMEDKADLVVITDPDYLRDYFSDPQKLDILIINEDLYYIELERHNIANIFILKESEMDNLGHSEANQIYKYSSVKEIYNEVINKSSASKSVPLESTKETKILMMYSPIGGIGKTTLSAALCEVFTKYHKKVLFIGLDNLQTFGSVIENIQPMEIGMEKIMTEKNDYTYEVIKKKIVSTTFDILPPFWQSLPSLNIKIDDFIFLLNCMKESKDYDYVVIDGANDFNEDISRLMGLANHTIVVAGQAKNAVFKLNCLLKNIDCSDKERFIFVCNKYIEEEENFLLKEGIVNLCSISEYIENDTDSYATGSDFLLNNKNLQKLALMFI